MKFKQIGINLFLLFIFIIIPFVLTSCRDNMNSSPLFFPTWADPDSSYPTASFNGWLALDKNSLRLKSLYFGKGYLIIWPYGYSLKTENGQILILNNNGEAVAKVGDRIKGTGGEIPLESVEQLLGKPLPNKYGGPYCVIGEIKK